MNESLLVNTLGHSAGVLIFGIFLYLLVQDRAARRLRGSTKFDAGRAAGAGWNLASLLVLGANPGQHVQPDSRRPLDFRCSACCPRCCSICACTTLPAAGRCGICASAVTIVLHVTELFRESSAHHRLGLQLITIGFGRSPASRRSGFRFARRYAAGMTSRLVGTMSLFLLAMSFVHLGGGHVDAGLVARTGFHHAAIPLALLVLLQDYRFVLLDAFLRFLANVFLAALSPSRPPPRGG